MSMSMSSLFIVTKPSICINHVISANLNRQSFLASRTKFHHNLSSSSKGKRMPMLTVRSNIDPPPNGLSPSLGGFVKKVKSQITDVIKAFLQSLLRFLWNKWGPMLINILMKIKRDQELQMVENVEGGFEKITDGAEHMAEDIVTGKELKKAVGGVEHMAEDIVVEAEGLEKMADGVEHKAEDVVKNFPGKSLKGAANFIENATEKIKDIEDEASKKIEENKNNAKCWETFFSCPISRFFKF
ncbi:uncharacterized protein LOC110706640 [Chenopodium quinoa]|uniref:uncharacterized protein LOC110706640 n=1 Tax=Chenopodium quinoa TaxID=63459 RepID=UPI000B7724DA|nr:uncharacterized protein LOC110706640 [Chenopodium quinoa]